MGEPASKYGSITEIVQSPVVSDDDAGTASIRATPSITRDEESSSDITELTHSSTLDRLENQNCSSLSYGEWESISSRMSDLKSFAMANCSRIFKHDWCLLTSLLLITYTANLAVSYYVAFYPQYASKWHQASPFEIGVIMSTVYISIVIINPLIAKLIDEIDVSPEMCMWFGFLCSFASAVWFCFIEEMPGHHLRYMFLSESIGIRLLQGLGVSLVNVSAGAISLKYFDGPVSAESGNLIQFSIALGYMSGPPIGGIIYHFWRWSVAFETLAVLHVIVFIIALTLFYIAVKEENGSEEQEASSTDAYRDLLYNPLVIFLVLNNVIGIMEFAFMHPTLGLHLQEQIGATELLVGIVFLVRDVAYLIAFVLLMFVQKFSGPFLILMFGHILTGIGYLLLGPAAFLGLSFSLILLFGAIVIIGCGVASPMVSTLDSLLLVMPLRRRNDNELAMKTVLKTFYIILNSSFYTGSLLGTSAGGLLQFAFRDYAKTYTVFAVALFIQSALVLGFAIYLKVALKVDFIVGTKKTE